MSGPLLEAREGGRGSSRDDGPPSAKKRQGWLSSWATCAGNVEGAWCIAQTDGGRVRPRATEVGESGREPDDSLRMGTQSSNGWSRSSFASPNISKYKPDCSPEHVASSLDKNVTKSSRQLAML